MSLLLSFLPDRELIRIQHLNRLFFDKVLPRFFSKKQIAIKQDIPSTDNNKNIYQFFDGFLLTIDARKSFDQIKE